MCTKSIEIPVGQITYENCEGEVRDPTLNQWITIKESNNILAENQNTQIKTDNFYHYVYCFPGEIIVLNMTMECPPHVFKLTMDTSFQIQNRQFKGTSMNLKLTNRLARQMQIEFVHLNHTDTDGELELLKTIEQLKQVNAELEKNSILPDIQKLSTTWTVITAGGIGLLFLSCLIIVCWLRMNNRNRDVSQPTVALNVINDRSPKTPELPLRSRSNSRSISGLTRINTPFV